MWPKVIFKHFPFLVPILCSYGVIVDSKAEVLSLGDSEEKADLISDLGQETPNAILHAPPKLSPISHREGPNES